MSRNSRLLRLIGAIGAMYLEWGGGDRKFPRPGVVNPFQMGSGLSHYLQGFIHPKVNTKPGSSSRDPRKLELK